MGGTIPDLQNLGRYLWLKNEVVPKIVETLKRGTESYRCEIKPLTDSYFTSAMYKLEISFLQSRNEEVHETVKLVVKVPPDSENARIVMRTNVLFPKEILFYRRFGEQFDDYPNCLFALPQPADRAVIVLNDATEFGYSSLQSKDGLSLEQALAAIKGLAKFHARGYVMKEKDAEEFSTLLVDMEECQRREILSQVAMECINSVSSRPVDYLRSVANYDPLFCDKMAGLLANVCENVLADSLKPRNDLAVLCHGDFTANNVLFRQEEDGKFTAMLIDFAEFRYASPATDLATFIYVSCGDKLRSEFPTLFRIYHNAVIEYLEERDIQDLDRYSYDAFLRDYKRHAIYGYAVANYFMQIIALYGKPNCDLLAKNVPEYCRNMLISGGDKLSKKLADMLLELREDGYLEHVL